MPSKSKTIGKNAERDIADIFSRGTGTTWQRVPNSGAFLGGHNLYRAAALTNNQILLHRGDLIPGEGYEGCVIEVKKRGEFNFASILTKKGCKELFAWIDQAMVDYEGTNGKFFAVVFKYNRNRYILTISGQTEISGEDGPVLILDYKNRTFVITEFDVDWVVRHAEQIRNLCNAKPK